MRLRPAGLYTDDPLLAEYFAPRGAPPAGGGAMIHSRSVAVNATATIAGSGIVIPAHQRSVAVNGTASIATSGVVVPVLTSITVTPSNSTFRPDDSADRLQMTATGHYTSGGDQDITDQVTWASGDTNIATVSNGAGTEGEVAAVAGAITGASAATVQITATLGAIQGSTNVTVDTDVDGPNSWRVPVNAYQWSIMGETPPSAWDCQNASGNLSDTIGSLTLTAGATPLYAQDITDWTRNAVGFDDASADRFVAGVGVGPNPATTSQAWAAIVQVPSTLPADRSFLGVLTATLQCAGLIRTTGVMRINVATNTADGTSDHRGGIHLFIIQHDITNSKSNFYSELDKVVGTFSATVADGNKGLGPVTGANTGAYRILKAWLLGSPERTTGAVATLVNKITKTTVSWS